MRAAEASLPSCTHSPWHEVFLNIDQAAATSSVAESVALGHSFLVLADVSSPAESAAIAKEASSAAADVRDAKCLAGLVRSPIAELIGAEGTALCDALLRRQLAMLSSTAAPTLTADLFGDVLSSSPDTVLHNARLAWSEGEPAINAYTEGGCFTPHEDEQSLTCLLNVSPRNAYCGGGTAFWSIEDAGPKRSLVDTNPPTHLVTPAAGTAVIFGGTVTHAAQPIESALPG